MKIAYIAASAVLLAACTPTPPPLCDRAAIEWDKYGTAEVPQSCEPEVRYVPVVGPRPDRDSDRDIRVVVGIPPSDGPAHPDKPERHVKKNNGLGNGDQKAPGRSLTRNRAENQVGNPGHKSGKAQNSD